MLPSSTFYCKLIPPKVYCNFSITSKEIWNKRIWSFSSHLQSNNQAHFKYINGRQLLLNIVCAMIAEKRTKIKRIIITHRFITFHHSIPFSPSFLLWLNGDLLSLRLFSLYLFPCTFSLPVSPEKVSLSHTFLEWRKETVWSISTSETTNEFCLDACRLFETLKYFASLQNVSGKVIRKVISLECRYRYETNFLLLWEYAVYMYLRVHM